MSRPSRPSSRRALRWATIVCAVGLATVPVVSSAPAEVDAQDRPPCSDGPANAWDQVRGEILDSILPDFVDNPYGPESIDDVATRCLQLPDPGAGPVPGLPGGPGTNRGDPHIVTQDGVAYDFHAAGDFVLLRSPTNDVEMQVRYRRSTYVSLFAGVAIREGDTTLTVENFVRGEDPVVTLDGAPLTLAAIGWYDLDIGFVMRTEGSIYVELDNGIRFEARRAGLTLLTPATWAGQFVGIQGNGNGDVTDDLATADGTLVNAADTDTLYGEFLESWYVEPTESFFTIPFDEQRDGPVRPEEIITLADLDAADVAAAYRVCTDAGWSSGFGLDDCTFDVAVTGDPFWAENVAAATVASVPAVGLDPVVEGAFSLSATGAVAPDDPESGAGRIEQRYGADDYAVDAIDDGQRRLRVTGPCAPGPRPVAVVIIAGDPIESLPLDCDVDHEIPVEAFTLRVIDPNGGTPDYSFILARTDVDDLGQVVAGEEYSGELAAGDRVTGSLAFDAGTAVFVTVFDDADCGPVVTVLDTEGTPQATPRAACLDQGPIELTGPAPFTIDITATVPGSYHFMVTEVAPESSTAAAAGRDVVLDVTTPGQRASATIDLTTGDRVYIETVEHVDGDLVLTGPDGRELATEFSFTDLGLLTAPTDGTYTVTIQPDNAATGIQRLVFHDVADDTTTPARIDNDTRLRITTPGQRASATIDLTTGDRVYIETVEHVDGDLVLTGPDGRELATEFSFTDLGLLTAPTDGTYTVTIQPDNAATGIQRLVFHDVADDTTTPARIDNDTRLRITTPGQRASATIDLTTGERIEIETRERINGRLVVTGPNGNVVASVFASQDLGIVTADDAGTYTVTLEPEEASVGTQVLLIRRA